MFTEERFTTLAKRYMDMIFRLAFSYLKNAPDADDITQNVLLSLYRTNKVFESEAHIKNWLIRVTVNECKNALRSPWRRTEDLEEYAGRLSFYQEGDGELFRQIMALDVKYRAVIVLYYYEGYSIEEMAHILNIPKGTAGTRLVRARKNLRERMEAKDYD